MNLINKFYELRGKKNYADHVITQEDMASAKTILFAMFSRYGDFFATLKVIKELELTYGEKKLLFVVAAQFKPYIQEFFPSADIFVFNKRNPIDIISTILKLKDISPDIGLNPWSHGSESEFLISFAKKYKFYANDIRCSPPITENLYDKPRIFLELPLAPWTHTQPAMASSYDKIIICPDSSDMEKSLDSSAVLKLVSWLQIFKPKQIVVAATKKIANLNSNVVFLKLTRSTKSSKEFLHHTKSSNLVVTADSGPLHLAHILNIPTIAYFSKTAPEWVLDTNSNIVIMRTNKLHNIYCQFADNGHCKEPKCMNENFKNFMEQEYIYNDLNKISRVNYCAMDAKV